jgi:ABC-type branched-subunit amino acid transport system ATPase component
VLSNVTFTIPQSGTVSALIGPNGAGKTTLLNLLTALDVPTGGRIQVMGADVTDLSPHRVAGLGVARTFQVPRLAIGRSALDNVVMGMHRILPEGFADQLVSSPRARSLEQRAAADARELLAAVGLEAWWHRDVADLPHGLRRFVEVARGLACRPAVFLLDEPGAGLEQSEVAALSRILTMAARDFSVAVLVVDHNMELVLETATDVVVLDAGHIIAHGTPQAVTADPVVQDAYLGRLTGADVGVPA